MIPMAAPSKSINGNSLSRLSCRVIFAKLVRRNPNHLAILPDSHRQPGLFVFAYGLTDPLSEGFVNRCAFLEQLVDIDFIFIVHWDCALICFHVSWSLIAAVCGPCPQAISLVSSDTEVS